MVSAAADTPQLKVYVSFSGSDIRFADKVISGLRKDGRFTVSADPDSMIDEEDWKIQIRGLIAEADAIIFILSPESARTCTWEVGCADQLSKRIVPVLCRPPGEIDMPDELAGRKYVRFEGERSFARDFNALAVLLNTSKSWIRQHTRLYASAHKWQQAGRPEKLLLARKDILAAKMWTLDRPKDAPKPTDLHLTFINTSEAVDRARLDEALKAQADLAALQASAGMQAQNTGSVNWVSRLYMVIGAVLAIVGLLAGWQTADARKQAADARKQAAEASQQVLVQRQAAEQTTATLTAQGKLVEDALKKVSVSLCDEASRVTSMLGTTSDATVWDTNYNLFWTLYEGPMLALQQLDGTSLGLAGAAVTDSLAAFGNKLGERSRPKQARADGLPRISLLAQASSVTNACAKFADAN